MAAGFGSRRDCRAVLASQLKIFFAALALSRSNQIAGGVANLAPVIPAGALTTGGCERARSGEVRHSNTCLANLSFELGVGACEVRCRFNGAGQLIRRRRRTERFFQIAKRSLGVRDTIRQH